MYKTSRQFKIETAYVNFENFYIFDNIYIFENFKGTVSPD